MISSLADEVLLTASSIAQMAPTLPTTTQTTSTPQAL
jgi:hypothetical protein